MGMNLITHEQFEDLWSDLELIHSTGPSTVGRLRKDHDGPWPTEDDVSRYLTEKGLVLRADPEGVFHVDCPWKDTHTTLNTLTGTSYFAGGGFKCFHSHCANRKTDEYLAEIGYQPTGFEEFTGTRNSGSQPVDFQLLTVEELAELPPTRWCIKGVLPQEGLAAIYGPSGSGKSFLVIDLAMAVASGKPWFTLRTKKTPVVYCALEGEGGIAQRVVAYQSRYGACVDQMRFLLQPFNLLAELEVAALGKAIIGTGCEGGVTILDTLNRATPGTDENDSKDMGQIIAAAKHLKALIGGVVVLVHHTGKDSSKGLRGHSSLLAALDSAIEIVRGGHTRSWSVAKCKDGSDGLGHCFRLEEIQLKIDEEGDPITSCVVVPEGEVGTIVAKVKVPHGANQQIILKAIRELLQSHMPLENEDRPACVPSDREYISQEEAILKLRDRLSCQADQRTRSTHLAVNGLVKQGFLELKEGYLWEP